MKTRSLPAALILLALMTSLVTARAADPAPPDAAKLRTAITRALAFLAKEGDQWIEEKNCNGCHHLPELLWSHREAKLRGFPIDQTKLDDWAKWANSRLAGGAAGIESTAFMVLAKPDKPLPTAEKFILDSQQPDGSWKPAGQFTAQHRSVPEAQATSTRICLLALGATPGPESKAVSEARAKATAWLAKNDPPDSVDTWVYRALYAQRFGKPEEVEFCRNELRKLQHADGGWGWWNKETQSDSLATGEVLHLLSPSQDPGVTAAVARAQNWLISTQREDGGWSLSYKLISTRDRSGEKNATSLKNANGIYSYWGSTWAALGLLQGIPLTESALKKDAAVP